MGALRVAARALVCALMTAAAPAALAAPPSQNLNPGAHNAFFWQLPPQVSQLSDVQQNVTIDGVGSYTYWALGGYFAKAPTGDGWYLGLQTDGSNSKGQDVGDQAVFSIWNATAATPGQSLGADCATFASDGTGKSCHAPISIEAGHSYALAVAAAGSATGPTNVWRALVEDLTTQTYYEVGTIVAPPSDTNLTGLYNFIENFSTAACADQQAASGQFADPTLNLGGNLAATFQQGSDSLGPCATGTILTGPGGVGAILGPGPAPNPPVLAPPVTRHHTPPGGEVTIETRSARVHRRRVAIRLACSGSTRAVCSGQLALWTRITVHVPLRRRAEQVFPLLAKATYRLRAGTEKTILLRLRTALRLDHVWIHLADYARRHRIRARAIAAAGIGTGTAGGILLRLRR